MGSFFVIKYNSTHNITYRNDPLERFLIFKYGEKSYLFRVVMQLNAFTFEPWDSKKWSKTWCFHPPGLTFENFTF